MPKLISYIKILFTMTVTFCSSSAMELSPMDVEQIELTNQRSFDAYPQGLSNRMIKGISVLCDMAWRYGEMMTELHNCFADDDQNQELAFINEDANINASETGLYFGNVATNDIIPLVLSELCYDQNAIENLYVCSQVCIQWYRASKSKDLNPMIKMRYCGHLPKEYMDNLEDGQQMSPPQLVRFIFERQHDEMGRLTRILQGSCPNILFGHDPWDYALIERVEKSLLSNLLSQLKNTQPTSLTGSSLYDFQEHMLERINTELTKACLEKTEISTGSIGTINGGKPFKDLNICLHGAMTRLTLGGISIIKEKVADAEKDVTIKLILTSNKLRWLPDDLFPLPRVEELDLRNNLLHYLPSTISWTQDHLKKLYIGNHQGSGLTCSCCDLVGLRTMGNIFKTVPQIILQLHNLRSLNLSNTGLENFNEADVYKALSLLKYVNLNHNNLMVLPRSQFGDRKIFIRDTDNPIYGRLTTNVDEWKYRFYGLSATIVSPILRHPIITLTGCGICVYFKLR